MVQIRGYRVTASINGFYAAYLTGRPSQSLAMLIFRNGQIVGADFACARFDGNYADAQDTGYTVSVSVKLSPNMTLIQGGSVGQEGDDYTLSFHLSTDFLSQELVRIDTKHGPVNAKLVKLRGLDD
jgi:hypothetical protein